jgi:N-acetylglucosaminyldiphosphoundecaprenol N-acetyl-beta-D-mannosaminyltransferase
MLFKQSAVRESAELGSSYESIPNTEASFPHTSEIVLPLSLQFCDCRLPEFIRLAADFGTDSYAFAVTPNVDHLIRYCDDLSFRSLCQSAQFVLLDSRFLALILRLTVGIRVPVCTGSDVTAHLFGEVIRHDDKIVLIGGTDAQATTLSNKYELRGLKHFNPPMDFIHDSAAVETCLRFIENESPFRFCVLAVGCPQQEVLARAMQLRGRARGLALCVGAGVNFLTGAERRAPKWVQKGCIEWAYRLINDPLRLSKRYLVRGPRIFFLLPRLKFGLRSLNSDVAEGPLPLNTKSVCRLARSVRTN